MFENHNKAKTVHTGGAAYVGYRAELLAKLALSRFPELSIHESGPNYGYDFVIVTQQGGCFFVIVKAISSLKLKIRNIETIFELRWRIERQSLQWAKSCPNPVFLFLIDADTDHGRYLRLNDIAQPKASGVQQTIRFPIENTINKPGLERLVTSL